MALLDWFHALDLHLLRLINLTWTAPWLDLILGRVADFDSFKLPLALAVVLTLVWGRFRGRLLLVTMLLCLLLGDATINWGLKIAVHRPRPMESIAHLRVVTASGVTESQPHATLRGRSFTSGHACNNVALALVACAIFGRGAAWFWLWALLVSYARIYGANHYPSDILGSWLVALAYSFAILYGLEALWQRWAPGRCPGLYQAWPRLYPHLPRNKPAFI